MLQLDLAQWSLWLLPNPRAMNKTDKLGPNKEPPRPKPSRSDEALRIIEEYANALREIIEKLRQRLD
jgi:hypothetical protein